MFKVSPLIFLLTQKTLRVARVNRDGTALQDETIFDLDENGLAGALKEAKKKFGQGARMVIPEEYLYVTRVEVELSPKDERSLLEEKIISVFPETLGGFAWDYEVLTKNTEKGEVELSGIVRNFGEMIDQSLGSAHYRVEAIIPESYALARLVPRNEVSLVVHEKETGWLSMLISDKRVVTSIFLTKIPTQNELNDLITFGTERKHVTPQKILFSLVGTSVQVFPQMGLPQVVLSEPLNPMLGAAKILLGEKDENRMDLPLRGNRSTWISRLLTSFS